MDNETVSMDSTIVGGDNDWKFAGGDFGGSEGVDWKNKLLGYYQKLLNAIAYLDFRYPIKWADNAVYCLCGMIEADLGFLPAGAENDMWYEMTTGLLRMAKDAGTIASDTRRSEAYYGMANYITDHIDFYNGKGELE